MQHTHDIAKLLGDELNSAPKVKDAPKLSHIPGPYRVQEIGEYRFDVVQPNGTVVASCARKETAGTCANALNACAVLPILKPA